jgi:hypothetical protein
MVINNTGENMRKAFTTLIAIALLFTFAAALPASIEKGKQIAIVNQKPSIAVDQFVSTNPIGTQFSVEAVYRITEGKHQIPNSFESATIARSYKPPERSGFRGLPDWHYARSWPS